MKIRVQFDFTCKGCKSNGTYTKQEHACDRQLDTAENLERLLPDNWMVIWDDYEFGYIAVFCAECRDEEERKLKTAAIESYKEMNDGELYESDDWWHTNREGRGILLFTISSLWAERINR